MTVTPYIGTFTELSFSNGIIQIHLRIMCNDDGDVLFSEMVALESSKDCTKALLAQWHASHPGVNISFAEWVPFSDQQPTQPPSTMDSSMFGG